MSAYLDPMAAAVEEAERPSFIFGQLEATAAFVQFVDKRKTVWTEHDKPENRRTEVTLVINPLEETGMTRLFTRSAICNNTGEWADIVWPSLRDGCGIKALRDADKKFVKVEIVKTGRKYTNKAGEEVENTTFKFLALYADKSACVSEFLASGQPRSTLTTANGQTPTSPAQPADPSDMERENCRTFLPMLVKAAGGNRQTLAQNLAAMAPLNKYFNVDSPEVVALLAA